MKKIILMLCLMAFSTLSITAQAAQEQEGTLLVGCPCKNKDKKPT